VYSLMAKEHTKNARPSNWEKHTRGKARRQRDQGGEKGDKRRKAHFRRRRRRPDAGEGS
jgi:hypothetical protein